MVYDHEDLDRMKLSKPGTSLFSLMVFLSLFVHAAAIGWIANLPGLGLAGLLESDGISARIIAEKRPGRGAATDRGTFAGPEERGTTEGAGKTATENAGGGGVQPAPAVRSGAEADSGHVSSNSAEEVAGTPPERPVETEVPLSSGEREKVSNSAEGVADSSADYSVEPGVPVPAPEQLPAQPAPPAASGLLKVSMERFFFEIYWLGIYVGKAVLEAENTGGIQRITSRVNSAPVISAFYKVEDFAESTVSGSKPVRFRIKQREGKYRSDKETLFDPGGRITYFDHLKGIREEHEVRDRALFDVISGFFYLRTRPMEAGSTVLLDVFDSNKFLVTEVNVLRNEQVAFLGREAEAMVVRPVLKSEGLFQSKGDIFIWLTNDERRIPVRVETKVGIGTVVAELKGMEREP